MIERNYYIDDETGLAHMHKTTKEDEQASSGEPRREAHRSFDRFVIAGGKINMRCEGWTRNSNAFSLGKADWKQCENEAVVMLKVNQDGENAEEPVCIECWNKAKKRGIEILSVEPLEQ